MAPGQDQTGTRIVQIDRDATHSSIKITHSDSHAN